jgi:hypothetical protein
LDEEEEEEELDDRREFHTAAISGNTKKPNYATIPVI